jgi:hypothetical protein
VKGRSSMFIVNETIPERTAAYEPCTVSTTVYTAAPNVQAWGQINIPERCSLESVLTTDTKLDM